MSLEEERHCKDELQVGIVFLFDPFILDPIPNSYFSRPFGFSAFWCFGLLVFQPFGNSAKRIRSFVIQSVVPIFKTIGRSQKRK